MTYIHVPMTEPTARARMLAGRLSKTIEEFKRDDPDTDSHDIEQALRLTQESEAGGSAGRAILIVALCALGAIGLVVFFALAR